MNRNSIVSKSMSYLFLVVMSFNFFCSAFCAANADGCCGKENREQHGKFCNSYRKDLDNNKGDCQDMHLAFFNTLGQFDSGQTVDAIKVFHTFFAFNTPTFIIQSVSQNKNVFAYIGFHPPPAKPDIRIFIQSFQI